MAIGVCAPRRPLVELPGRRAGSVRRTMHVDVGARTGWGADLFIAGAARDLRTGTDTARPEVTAEAALEAEFDGGRQLAHLRTRPARAWTAQLLGARAGGGFRRRLDEVVPASERRSLLGQVLDDVPAAVLISGYGFMRLARRAGHPPQSLTPPGVLDRMVGLCSGWRPGGTAVESIAAGHGVPLQDCPPASDLGGGGDDAWALHACGPLAPDAMRRRRCLDAAVADDGTVFVWAMFRDTVGEPGGGEAVLHEYVVSARVEDGVLRALEAEPRVLPFGECPAAAGQVGALVGTPLAALSRQVPATLAGTACCTHLNDLLRALAGLADLAPARPTRRVAPAG
jgi:hypothetical protein